MKVLFVGPSLYGSPFSTRPLDRRGPAAQGDITRAVLEGAKMIGLVDGYFGWRGAVWHKEILFALSRGVHVLGAASMGALRAAECERFGMEPVGVIANRYLSAQLDDDAAVALTHASAEEGYRPLTEPLVDAHFRIEVLLDSDQINEAERNRLREVAQALFFQDRTIDTLLQGGLGEARAREVKPRYTAIPGLKRHDAERLVTKMILASLGDRIDHSWQLETPIFWRRILQKLDPVNCG